TGPQIGAAAFGGGAIWAIITALERGAHRTFDLPGPESMTLDDLVRLLNRDQTVPIRHVPAPRTRRLPLLVRDLPRTLVDVMLGDGVGNPTQVKREFGLMLASLRQVWSPAR